MFKVSKHVYTLHFIMSVLLLPLVTTIFHRPKPTLIDACMHACSDKISFRTFFVRHFAPS